MCVHSSYVVHILEENIFGLQEKEEVTKRCVRKGSASMVTSELLEPHCRARSLLGQEMHLKTIITSHF